MIELQGKVIAVGVAEELDGLHLGTLNEDGIKGPTLKIGNHLLHGRVVSLPKTLVITKRIQVDDASITVDRPDAGTHRVEDSHSPRRETRLQVLGIITKKMLFKTRPTPLVRHEK